MSGPVQLDLFDYRPGFDRSSAAESLQPCIPEELSDEGLISAIPDAGLADADAMAAEAGRRRLTAAVPALASRCNRFVGYGADVAVPEQAAALQALALTGGPEASQAVVQLIVRRIVQGPTLANAITVASQLRVIFPIEAALALLQHSDPSVRTPTCACVRSGYEVVTILIAMLDDTDDEVAIASACALGRMGRMEALIYLKRYLTERPSVRVVEALVGVADDEAIVFLQRAGHFRRELAPSIISALEEIDTEKALKAAATLKRVSD